MRPQIWFRLLSAPTAEPINHDFTWFLSHNPSVGMNSIELLACSLTGFIFGWETQPDRGLASIHLVVLCTPVVTQCYEPVVVCVVVLVQPQRADNTQARRHPASTRGRVCAAHLKRWTFPFFWDQTHSPQAIKSLFLDCCELHVIEILTLPGAFQILPETPTCLPRAAR